MLLLLGPVAAEDEEEAKGLVPYQELLLPPKGVLTVDVVGVEEPNKLLVPLLVLPLKRPGLAVVPKKDDGVVVVLVLAVVPLEKSCGPGVDPANSDDDDVEVP